MSKDDNQQQGWGVVAKMEQEADAITASEVVDGSHGRWQHTAIVASPHPAPPCASVLGMSPIRQEKEEGRPMEREEEFGKMLGVQKYF